jgi:hypothetical protein
MEPWIPVFVSLILGALCAVSAKSRGRPPFIWFFVGLLLGWIGVLILFILPVLKEEEKKEEQQESLLPIKPEVEPGIGDSTEWFYLDHQKIVRGPCSATQLQKEWDQGSLSLESWVWNEKTVDWKKIKQLKSLTEWLQK